MTDDRLEALRAVLAEERQLLRQGALERLAPIVEQKRELVEELTENPPISGSDALIPLRALARSNAEMLQAASQGVRSALDRMSERAHVAGHLDTYDAKGRKHSFAAPRADAPRRA